MGSRLSSELWLPRLLEWIEDGRLIRDFCKQERVPSEGQLRAALKQWAAEDPEVAARIEGAKEAGYDAIADSVLAIVDDLDGDPDAASRRTRAWARIELLGRWSRRYGPRSTVEQQGKVTVQVVTGVPQP